MTVPKLARLAIPLLALATSSCVFAVGGTHSDDTGFDDGFYGMDEGRQPDHFPGQGLPLMVAPWEGVSSSGLEITGVGYSSNDDGPSESDARNAALADAHERAKIMVGAREFMLLEKQTYSATSDTDLGVKVLYGIMM